MVSRCATRIIPFDEINDCKVGEVMSVNLYVFSVSDILNRICDDTKHIPYDYTRVFCLLGLCSHIPNKPPSKIYVSLYFYCY